MSRTALLFVHALAPLHAGTGQGTGVIDLPIAREKATGLPYLPASSVKGVLRDACDPKLRDKVFGFGIENRTGIENPNDPGSERDYAGSAQFGDQRLLLLPVRSMRGTFAWVTSPYLLRRLARDAAEALRGDKAVPSILNPAALSEVMVSEGSGLMIQDANKATMVYLEDIDLKGRTDGSVTAWSKWLGDRLFAGDSAWQQILKERLCIVNDDVMSFLLQTATEVIARIKMDDERKTVDTKIGGLWYEEALPAETVLVGMVVAQDVGASKAKVADTLSTIKGLSNRALQFGGKATVGRGVCRILYAE